MKRETNNTIRNKVGNIGVSKLEFLETAKEFS